jgi:hypothetical protein
MTKDVYRPILFVSAVLLFVATVLFGMSFFINKSSALAADDLGYFFRRSRTANFSVINAGLPAAINTQESFITYIEGRLWAGVGSPSAAQLQDRVGAQYIIQTMRGAPAGSPFPGAAEIADWKARIRNPAVSVVSVSTYNDTLTSSRFTNGQRDVSYHNRGSSNNDAAFIFRFPGGEYAVRRACANPVGNFAAVPLPVPSSFTLTPSAPATRSAAEPGETVVVSPTVDNAGNAASSNTQWQFTQFVVPPAGSYPGAGVNAAVPAAYYGNGLVALDSRTGASFPLGRLIIGSPSIIIPDLPVGTRVCYALSVQARSNSDGRWAHSTPSCVIIAKKPKIQIQGSDLIVGKSFVGATGTTPVAKVSTGISTKDISGVRRTFGSWIEYGIVASGTVTGAGSGSAYSAGGLVDTAAQCESKLLTFTNTPAGSPSCSDVAAAGGYTSSRQIPDIASSFPVGSTTPSLGNNPTVDLTSSTARGVVTATGNVTLTGGASPIAKGRWLVINAPDATVTITGNILYTTEVLQVLSEIPQLVIIAKNINIIDSVSQIDAWLIAKPTPAGADGKINTCSSVAESAPLSSTICAGQLTVNGPVMAQKLVLRRTAGSGSGSATGDPAEVFNTRPDAYLWATLRATNTGRIQTVQTTELPPRL